MDTNLAYQDDAWAKRREELISGKVVMMAPASSNHNRIAGNIFSLFHHYLKGQKCVPFGDNEKVFLTDTDHYVPDFMIVCDRDKIKPNGVHGAPDLVVEILSPGTAKNDRTRKKEIYEMCCVPEYWLVSPGERSIEVYWLENNSYVLHDIYTLPPDWALETMKDEEKAALVTEFRCRLYDDLTIRLEDIFDDLL